MIWITGLITALLVLAADFASTSPVEGAGRHALTGLVFVSLAPGFAVFQSFVTTRRWKNAELSIRRADLLHRSLMMCNLVIWLFGCVALLAVAKWPQVVRQNWQLKQIPLLDELILVLPMLASIIMSWIVMHDAESVLRSGGEQTNESPRRFDLTLQRLRTIFGMILVPIGILFLARDVMGVFYPDGAGNLVTVLYYMTFLTALLAGYPLLVSLGWRTTPITDPELAGRLKSATAESGLAGEKILVWDTGGTISNAMVAGIVPGLRRIFLSDQLLATFEPEEVVAICRHELGHLRLGHLTMRLALFLVPLMVLAVWSTAWTADGASEPGGVAQAFFWAVVPFAFLLYVLFVVGPFIRKSEIEADLYAIQRPDGLPCPDRAEAYCTALLKMAAHSPNLYQRSTMVHPSIQLRIEVLRQALQNPDSCRRFSGKFRLEQILAAGFLVALLSSLMLFV